MDIEPPGWPVRALGWAPGAAEVLSLVSGLWPPVLNETKLRENATNNPGQRCTCSKHGLSLAGMSAPGDLNCRGFFGLLFSYPFGLFIPRVLDT